MLGLMQYSAHKKMIEKVLKQRLGRYFTPPTQLLSLQTLTQTRKKTTQTKNEQSKIQHYFKVYTNVENKKRS